MVIHNLPLRISGDKLDDKVRVWVLSRAWHAGASASSSEIGTDPYSDRHSIHSLYPAPLIEIRVDDDIPARHTSYSNQLHLLTRLDIALQIVGIARSPPARRRFTTTGIWIGFFVGVAVGGWGVRVGVTVGVCFGASAVRVRTTATPMAIFVAI